MGGGGERGRVGEKWERERWGERDRERWRDGGEQEINMGGCERKMRPR